MESWMVRDVMYELLYAKDSKEKEDAILKALGIVLVYVEEQCVDDE